jgi:hypothetical protein
MFGKCLGNVWEMLGKCLGEVEVSLRERWWGWELKKKWKKSVKMFFSTKIVL